MKCYIVAVCYRNNARNATSSISDNFWSLYLITFGHFFARENAYKSLWSLQLITLALLTLGHSFKIRFRALTCLDQFGSSLTWNFLCLFVQNTRLKKAEMCCSSPTLLVISLRRIKCNLRNKNVHDKPCAHLLEGICLNKVNITILPQRRHQLRISDKERNFFHYGSFCQSYQLFLSIWVASRTLNLPKEK